MTRWRVRVCDTRCAALTDADSEDTYLSPPQPEAQARALIALLTGAPPVGAGPWPRAIAGGRRTVELRPDREP